MTWTEKSLPPGTIAPLQQSEEFYRTLRLLGRPARRLCWIDTGKVLGHVILARIAPLGLMMASRGPIWHAEARPQEIARAMARLRDYRLFMHHGEAVDPMTHTLKLMTGATVAELPVTADWRDNSHAKWRYRLTRAEKFSPTLMIDEHAFCSKTDDWLINAYQATAQERRFRDWPGYFTQSFARANPGQCRVFSARQHNNNLGGMILLCHGKTATYHCAWSSDRGRQLDVNRLLLARAMDYLAHREISRLDMGLIDSDTAPDLCRFKVEAGAKARQLAGTYLHRPGFFIRQDMPQAS